MKKSASQIQIMAFFSLFFVGGVALFSLVPEESPWRVVIMPVYLTAMVWSLYRFSLR